MWHPSLLIMGTQGRSQRCIDYMGSGWLGQGAAIHMLLASMVIRKRCASPQSGDA